MKRTTTALLIVLAACMAASAALVGCATAQAEQPTPRTYEFRDVSDYFAPRDPEGAVRIAEEQAGKAAQAEREAAEAAQEAEAHWESQEAYYEPYSGYHGNPDGLNSFDGVNRFNGMTETFYSGSNAAYRGDLWADEDGFLRTADGYYAVATNNDEIPQGTVIETSQGQAMVVDGGADSGIVDFCVEGWY